MKNLTRFFSRTRIADSNPEPSSRPGGETSGGVGETADADGETVAGTADAVSDELPPPMTASTEEERKVTLMEAPPADDVCPICFGNFEVPCRGPCGHWFCGSCILQYWKFSFAFRPCKCPMCSQRITKLMPAASLYHSREVEVRKLLQNVGEYNRLFTGGISGFMLKLRSAIPMYIRRRFREALNGDRPLALLNDLRLFAMIVGGLYSSIPVDFIQIGEANITYLFDRSAFVVYFVVSIVGLYLRYRRQRIVGEMVDLEARND